MCLNTKEKYERFDSLILRAKNSSSVLYNLLQNPIFAELEQMDEDSLQKSLLTRDNFPQTGEMLSSLEEIIASSFNCAESTYELFSECHKHKIIDGLYNAESTRNMIIDTANSIAEIHGKSRDLPVAPVIESEASFQNAEVQDYMHSFFEFKEVCILLKTLEKAAEFLLEWLYNLIKYLEPVPPAPPYPPSSSAFW